LVCPYPKKSLDKTVALTVIFVGNSKSRSEYQTHLPRRRGFALRSVPHRRHIRTQLHRQWSHILQASVSPRNKTHTHTHGNQ